jgi:catechol 2,3-dioxygenase-like lactoylglutathione lyase family enzyme
MLTGHAPFLVVPDVTATLAWYRDVLGFESHAYVLDPEETGNAARDGCAIFFNRGERARPNSEIVPPDLFDVYLYTDDVEALHREWRDAGAEILHEPIDRPYNLREIRVRDPNGYVLGVGEPLEGYR